MDIVVAEVAGATAIAAVMVGAVTVIAAVADGRMLTVMAYMTVAAVDIATAIAMVAIRRAVDIAKAIATVAARRVDRITAPTVADM